MTAAAGEIRVGLDLGGTKIAAIAFDPQDEVVFEQRTTTPRGSYEATITTLCELVAAAENASGASALVGIGTPGSISPQSGLLRNANSTWLNDTPLKADLEAALARPLRLANDANCLALSEAHDGAAAGAATVFAIILGTGCGGGIVVNGQLLDGRHGIAGEWGHTPLPWPTVDEYPGHLCWCGRTGCLETWLSGPALSRDHRLVTGSILTGEEIAAAAADGEREAVATLERHADRLARGLACVLDIVDPDTIVIGGGLSALAPLYDKLPELIAARIFSDCFTTPILPAAHGDASGVRGAARLWPAPRGASEKPLARDRP